MATSLSTEVDVASAQELLRSGSVRILDLRENEEWQAGHIEGALHLPVAQLGARLGELRGTDTWLAICRTGSVSDRITGFLRDSGLDVRKVSGGIRAWDEAGQPLVTDGGGPGCVA